MENLLRDATARKARMEAGEAARRPSIAVVEPAVAPKEAWQPQYQRDAAIVLASALALALLAMRVVELFNREEVQPTTVVAQPYNYSGPMPPYGQAAPDGLGHAPNAAPRLAGRSGGELRDPALLAAPVPAPRELIHEELQAILHNASPGVRLFMHLLLRGVATEEALLLTAKQVDVALGLVHIGGARPRSIALDAGLTAQLMGLQTENDTPLLAAANPQVAVTLADLTTGLLYAAHDAGVEAPVEVTPEAVWHTGAAHLARQGIRLADLATALGHLSPQQAALYSSLAPAGRRLGWDEVEHLVPAAKA